MLPVHLHDVTKDKPSIKSSNQVKLLCELIYAALPLSHVTNHRIKSKLESPLVKGIVALV